MLDSSNQMELIRVLNLCVRSDEFQAVIEPNHNGDDSEYLNPHSLLVKIMSFMGEEHLITYDFCYL